MSVINYHLYILVLNSESTRCSRSTYSDRHATRYTSCLSTPIMLHNSEWVRYMYMYYKSSVFISPSYNASNREKNISVKISNLIRQIHKLHVHLKRKHLNFMIMNTMIHVTSYTYKSQPDLSNWQCLTCCDEADEIQTCGLWRNPV